LKRFVFILFLMLLYTGIVSAGEIPVEVTPVSKITTGNKILQEGDFVEFKLTKDAGGLKKGELVTGIVTSIEPNGFMGKAAFLSIEGFRLNESGQKLGGGVLLSGNEHNQVMEFKDHLLLPTMYVRGGEITLRPDKDIFILYLEN